MVLGAGIRAKDAGLVKAALASPKLDATALASSVKAAEGAGDAGILAMVKEAAARAPASAAPSYIVPPAVPQAYAGPYRNDPPVRTVYAVKVGSRGDLTLPKDVKSSDAIQWSNNEGRLYFASEDGDVYVVKAGAPYVEIAKNPVGEVIMTTPAVSNGVIYIRTMGGIVAIGNVTSR